MIEIYRTRKDKIKGFLVKGHADMAEHGRDIVCAAVSILTQTTVLGLSRYLGLQPEVMRKHGYLSCMLSERDEIEKAEVQAVFATMVVGLQEIIEQFPDFVQMEEYRR